MIKLTLEQARKLYENKGVNEKNNFINWDAVNALPEEMEPVFSKIEFDPKNLTKHFTNTGSEYKPVWYPNTDMFYDIAAASGVQGETYNVIESIYDTVDYNIIFLIPDGPGVTPCMRKIKTGIRVTKISSIIEPDNSRRLSGPEPNEFNFFTRACCDFLKEEDYTNTYTKKGKYDYKYNTTTKRKRHLVEMEKFALQNASTKAYCKTIRVLAGMPTGFKEGDLQSGFFVFVKFLKSKEHLKLEMAARLRGITNGNDGDIKQIAGDVFGDEDVDTKIITDVVEDNDAITPMQNITPGFPEGPPPENPFKDFYANSNPPQKTEKDKLIEKLEGYLDNEILNKTEGAIPYIKKTLTAPEDHNEEMLKKIIGNAERVISNYIPPVVKAEDEDIF